MSFARNLTVRTKILGAIGVAVLTMSAAAGISLVRINSASQTLATAGNQEATALAAAVLRTDFQFQHQKLKDILLRGSDPASYTKYTGEFGDQGKIVVAQEKVLRTDLAELHNSSFDKYLRQFDAGYANYLAKYTAALAVLHTPQDYDYQAGDAIMKGQDGPSQDALTALATGLDASATVARAHGSSSVTSSIQLAVIGFALAALLGLVAALLVARDILRRIQSMMTVAEQAAEGDLTTRAENTGNDELGRLGAGLNTTLGNLEALIARSTRPARP